MGSILAVDDDPDILRVVRASLTPSGHEVETTTDPEQAVSLAERIRPDVIVLDVKMPKLSGFEVLEALRSNPRTKAIPVLFLSSLREASDRIRGLRSGADDYLPKPFDPEELLVRLEGLVIQTRRPRAALQGSLEVYSLPEVLQFLEGERKTGTLSVISGAGAGAIELLEGRAANAYFDALQGEEAIVGMVGLDRGHFEFEGRALALKGEPAGGATLGLQSILMEAAWLADELSRFEVYVPPADVPLRLADGSPPQIPGNLQDLPFDEVFHILRSQEAMTLGRLIDQGVAAPIRLQLVLAWLLQQGSVVEAAAASTATAEGLETRSAEETREGPFRVLVVDDSPMMQRMLTKLYGRDEKLSVVGYAADGSEALSRLRELRPDVVSLDLFMPVLDGVATLKRIMLTQPTPTVIVTSGNPDDLDQAVESSLRFGALGFLAKPSGSQDDRRRQEALIINQVKDAARAELGGVRMVASPIRPARMRAKPQECRGIVCVAGGLGAEGVLRQLLAQMPADLPVAIVVSLALPGHFLRAFVSFAQSGSVLPLQRATDGDLLQGGVCYLAGSGEAVRIDKKKGRSVMRVAKCEARVAADDLFTDAAATYAAAACGVVLSGAGEPPERGLRSLREAGALTLAQLRGTCAHPEQTREALERGWVDRETAPSELAQEISRRMRDCIEG